MVVDVEEICFLVVSVVECIPVVSVVVGRVVI